MLFSTAYSSAGQFRNDGSTTFTRASVSAPAASTQCQIGPRQPSTRPVACAPARSGPGASNTAPGAARRAASPKIGRAQSELQSPCNLVCRLLLEKKKHTLILH